MTPAIATRGTTTKTHQKRRKMPRFLGAVTGFAVRRWPLLFGEASRFGRCFPDVEEVRITSPDCTGASPGGRGAAHVGLVRPGSAGVSGQERLRQVIPVAARTHLNHVARPSSLGRGEAESLLHLEGASVVVLEAVRVDVGQQAELKPLAYRARAAGLRPQVSGGSEELGVRIADLEPREKPAAEVADQRPFGQGVVDHTERVTTPLPGESSHRAPFYRHRGLRLPR